MGKKILKVMGVVGVLILAAGAWVVFVGNKRSPKETVAHAATDTKVTYCRPYKKGREIFGEGDKALVPYGKYWRLGANAATELVVSKPLSFAGKDVKPGTYRMYAVPSASQWKVVLNDELGWGANEPDHAHDVLTVEVPAEKTDAPLEQFTISFADADMVFAWDTTKVRVPLAAR